MGAQSSTNSIGDDGSTSPERQPYTPLCPHLRLPASQHPGDQCVLFIPLVAATQGNRGKFPVHWCDMNHPWFELEAETDLVGKQERLRLYEAPETHDGSNALCASVALSPSSSRSEAARPFIVDNSQLMARTNGLNMRTRKSMDESSRSQMKVIAWGQTVNGFDCGDGWLQVIEGGREYFLPMVVDGKKTILSGSVAHCSNDIEIMNGANVLFATLVWGGKQGRNYRYTLLRNGENLGDAHIPSPSGFLLEAMQNGMRLAQVDALTLGGQSKPDQLELLVEGTMDPVLMLICVIAMLRRLPPDDG